MHNFVVIALQIFVNTKKVFFLPLSLLEFCVSFKKRSQNIIFCLAFTCKGNRFIFVIKRILHVVVCKYFTYNMKHTCFCVSKVVKFERRSKRKEITKRNRYCYVGFIRWWGFVTQKKNGGVQRVVLTEIQRSLVSPIHRMSAGAVIIIFVIYIL